MTSAWGYTWKWTAEHPTREDIWPLKFKYDELAANAYNRTLEIFREQQAEFKSKELAADKSDKPNLPAPKPNVYQILKDNAATDPTLGALWKQVNTVPEWVDWEQLSRGQEAFYRYGVATMVGLAYQSLLGGFGAGRVVETLARTGGFSPAVSKRRLYETGQWNLEVTKDLDSIKPGGEGWISTIRVRLLHSAVRSRIMKMTEARPEYYNTEAWGIPVNDLDQAGTIGTFSAAPVWMALPRQGIYMRKQEIIDYIALWRYLAYLIGAPEKFFETPEIVKKFQETLLYYEIEPTETSRILAQNLVKGLQGEPPLYASADIIIAGARWLNGDELCDQLGLYRPSLYYRSVMTFQMVLYMAIAYTCRSIPWLDKKKIEFLKGVFWQAVVEHKDGLAGKKSDFHMKYTPQYDMKTELSQSYATRPGGRASLLWFFIGLISFTAAAYFFYHGAMSMLSVGA